jgi:hypothetical protein
MSAEYGSADVERQATPILEAERRGATDSPVLRLKADALASSTSMRA